MGILIPGTREGNSIAVLRRWVGGALGQRGDKAEGRKLKGTLAVCEEDPESAPYQR